ncbi:MAG: TonB-dependent receptor [Paludibacter sp.]|nr:TonB-dependent receptor [Paludibacter sp.]
MKKNIKINGSGRYAPQFKAKRILLSLILLLGSTNLVIYGQSIRPGNVTGQVTDETGATAPGASIRISGTTTGTLTDFDGKFSIRASPTDVLEISYVGCVKQSIIVGSQTQINVKLKSDSQMLGEMQVVAFGKQKKSSVISSITTIDTKELKVPSSNLTTAFAGKLAGVIAYQKGGDPGSENNVDFFVRGVSTMGASSSPLILIDGIESTSTDLSRLQPDDIASFSIMKDATSTALYGARGANGIMLVTTKEGKEGKAKLSVRIENTVSMPTSTVKFADPVTYMLMRNEATTTRGVEDAYNPEKIENTILGTNQYAYPAVDWNNMLFKKSTTNQRLNFNVSGGSKVARYYVGSTYNIDNGVLKVNGLNNFNNNIKLNSYQLRSNVNVNITKSTEVILRLGITMDNYKGPIDGGTGLYRKMVMSSPVDFPAYYPITEDLSYIHHVMFGNRDYNGGYMLNPYADMVKGYKQTSKSTVVSTFELKQDLNGITKGLNIRALFSTNRYATTGATRQYIPFLYNIGNYDPVANSYVLVNLNPTIAREYLDYTQDVPYVTTATYGEAAINYDRTFGKHGVSGLLVGYLRNYDRTATSTDSDPLISTLPTRNMGVSGRFTYNYDTRYFLEANFGYNGSERFAANHRFGFFPSVGGGWLLSNEKFWQDNLINTISKLKFKATYGKVGNDNLSNDAADRYFYLSQVSLANATYGYVFGQNWSNYQSGVSINRYANADISWEISTKTNYGVELELFRALELQVDYFTDNRTNVLMTRSNIPTTLGLVDYSKVRANTGSISSHGVDISLDYKKNFKSGLWITSHNTFTFATNKITKIDEPDYSATPWLSKKGNNFNQAYGYVAERLFVDEYDIANSPSQTAFGKVMAGDIKYKDINKDGVINGYDVVPIGHPTSPEINYGFGVSAGYKGFDLSVFFQGTARRAFWINPKQTAPFVNSSNDGGATFIPGAVNQLLQIYADNHWSEANRNPYALWPRLSPTLVTNNTQNSTWFMRDGSFMRMKNIECGYSIPNKVLKKIGFATARIYYSGTNLLTFSKFKLWDPEMGGNGLAYPIQKTHNVGLQMSF